jgi:hypothetical protein
VNALPALHITLTAIPQVLCVGESSTLTATGAANYTWTGGAVSSSITVTPASTTAYTVFAESGPGCWTSKGVNVNVNPLPVISISPSVATICEGESLRLEASGVFSFTWTPGNSNSPIFAVNPLVSTNYTVVGVDLNNCSNTASASIIVDACTGLTSHPVSSHLISVFPNPSNGRYQVVSAGKGKMYLSVRTLTGALLFSDESSDLDTVLDLSGYAKGIYFLEVVIDGRSENYKLVLN